MSVGSKLSRRKLAVYIADKIEAGESEEAIKQAAAYMVEMKQKRMADLLRRDIEDVLAERGTIIADITSTRKLTGEQKDAVAKLLDAKKMFVRETIDPSVLGGIKVEAAGRRLDATLRHKIDSLKDTSSRKGTK